MLSSAFTELRSRLDRAVLHEHGNVYRGRVEVSLGVMADCEGIPLAWLRAQSASVSRAYFAAPSSRGGGVIAGLGTCELLRGDGGLETSLTVFETARSLPAGARLIGGGRFDGSAVASPEWAALGGHHFILPAVTVEVVNSELIVGCNLRGLTQEAALTNALTWLDFVGMPPAFSSIGKVSADSTRIVPSESEWQRLVCEALCAIKGGELDKVVLARRERLHHASALEVVWQLEQQARQHRESCYRFCLALEGDEAAFAGCSPELLVSVDGSRAECDVIAGTRWRSPDMAADDELRDQLLDSTKDALENDIVRAFVERRLAKAVGNVAVQVSEVDVLELAHLRHLRRTLQVDVGAGSAQSLLAALHPTPATLGEPSIQARDFLRHRAAFDRGWYAGPFGTIAANKANFCVAIRSALFVEHATFAYAGAGIVKGSDLHAEADEINLKLEPLRRAVEAANQPIRKLNSLLAAISAPSTYAVASSPSPALSPASGNAASSPMLASPSASCRNNSSLLA